MVFGWAAIQGTGDNGDVDIAEEEVITKEQQEASILDLYDSAIKGQKEGNTDIAKEKYMELLEHPLVKEEMDATTKKLKFLALKNLGGIEKACGKKREALKYYASASDVDPSDIGVWYNIGCICMDLSMLSSSRYAFEKGLSCHPQDWGCLEKLLHVLEACGDEAAYLKVSSKAMMLDPSRLTLQSKRSKLLRLHQATQSLSLDKFPMPSMDPVEAQEEEPHKFTVSLCLGTSDNVWTEFGRVLYDLWNGGCGQGGSLVWKLEKEDEGEGEGRVEGKGGEIGEEVPNSRGKTKRVTEAERLKSLGQTDGGAGKRRDQRTGGIIEDLSAENEESGDGKVVRRVSRRQQTRVQQTRTQTAETGDEEETFIDVIQDVVGAHESRKVDWWGQAIGRMKGGNSGLQNSPSKHMYDEGAKLAKNMLQSFQGIHNNDCHICGDGGDLLCCETCSTVYHPTCLIRPPGPTEDLYCEECKQEALSLSNNEASIVINQDLFRSQYDSIAADFLPTVEENFGVLDVMRKFVLRVSSIQDPRVWKEEKDLPSIILKVAKSCKSYSGDIMASSRKKENDVVGTFNLDFDFECSLFLMEVALDQVIKKAGPNSLQEHGRDLVACEEFIVAVLDVLGRNMPEGFDVEDGERLVLSDEIFCRFWLLCTQLYALRGSVNEALFCVKQLEEAFRQLCLSKEGMNPGVGSTELICSFELPIPHLVAFPVLTLTSIQVKEASIISSGQMRDRVDKGKNLQQLMIEEKGQNQEACREFLKYVMERVIEEDGKEDQEFLEEIVMDMLTVETKLVTNNDKAGLLEVTAELLRIFSPKGSMLHMALFAALQLGDMTAAIGLMVRVVWYVTYIDRCADRCIKKMVTINPALLQQHNDSICKAGIRVLNYLATVLATIIKYLASDAAKETLGMDEMVLPTLVEVIMALYKNSTLMFSSALLEASMIIYKRLGPLFIEIEKAVMKGLCGVICDGEMSRNVLLNYLNTKEAQKYAHNAVRCLATMIEGCATRGLEGNFLERIFSEAEKEEVERALLDLLRLTDDDETSYGPMRFHIVHALVNTLQINMGAERCAKMFYLAHDLLAKKNSCKESNGVFLSCTLRFLYQCFPKMLQQPEEEEDGEGEAEGLGQEREAKQLLSIKVNSMAAQCFRCLYNCSIDPNTKEHEPIDLNDSTVPQGFKQTVQLAVYCLRFLEDEGSFGKKKDVLTALTMIYQDPQMQRPILTPPYYSTISSFFFHADPLLKPPDLLKHVDLPEDEDDVCAYGEVDTDVPIKDLLFVYHRLYCYIGQFSTHPKLLGKKGQREWELYLEYEKENLKLARIHLNDLKFNPTRVSSWVELSRTLLSLLYAYLDKSTACEYEGKLSSFLNPLDLSVFLEPILPRGAAKKLHDKLMSDKIIESYLDACLSGDSPEDQAFSTLKPSECISEETFKKSWMCLVTSAYRSMALKACTVTAELSRDMLAANDGDKKVAERAIDCYLQQAVVWYVGLADTKDKDKQRKQVGEVLRLLGEVREVETTYDTILRWDHPYILGKAKEKQAKIEASLTGNYRYQSNARRLKEILTLYNDALQLVESKSSKLEAFYRLHATRFKALMEYMDEEEGYLREAKRDIINILQRFTFSTDQDYYPKEASADTLRRFVFLDCMEAMAECRRQDRFNHRSMYRRARGLLVKRFFFPGMGGVEEVSLVEEAKECMFLLFEKKRPQVVAAWMPEERKDCFEAINQRYRKYDRMRIKYINLFLDLLKKTDDFHKLTGFYSWMKTIKEGDQVVQWMQAQTLITLLEMLKERVERIANEPDEVSAELLSLLDLAYDITMELLTDKTDPVQDLTPQIVEKVQMILRMTVCCCRQLFDEPGGAEGEAHETNISFEEALNYCHAKWPEKQGKQKLQRKMARSKVDEDQKHSKRVFESLGESVSQASQIGVSVQDSMAGGEGEESESSGSQNSPSSHHSKSSDQSAAKKRKIQKNLIDIMSSDEN